MRSPASRLLALVLAAALALAACGGDDSGDAASTEGNEELFTTAGFEEAVDAVADESGSEVPLLSVQVTQGGANFQVREGEGASGLLYTGGALEDVEIEVVGPGSLEGTDFPLSEVDPAAIDAIVEGARARSGTEDLELTVLTLERTPPDDELRWTINASGGGRGFVYTALPDGSEITEPSAAAERAIQPGATAGP